MNKSEQKEVAQLLYMQGCYTQADIADKVGISRNTMSKWVTAGNWDALRKGVANSKRERLAELYGELEEFNRMIKEKEGYKVASSKEADARRKLIADIEALESKYNISQTVMIAKDFCEFVKAIDYDFAQRVSRIFDMFISEQIENQKWQGNR